MDKCYCGTFGTASSYVFGFNEGNDLLWSGWIGCFFWLLFSLLVSINLSFLSPISLEDGSK